MKEKILEKDINTPFFDHLVNLLTNKERLMHLTEKTILFSINVILAILAFWILRKIIDRILLRYDKVHKKEKVKSFHTFSKSMLRLTLNFVAIMISLLILGVKQEIFIGLLGGAGIGIGLALKDTLANFAGGIILIVFKVYEIGDFIEIGGQRGKVIEINVFATKINTVENKMILVPNGLATGNQIINYTKNKMRKIDLMFGIAYESDFRQGIKILTEIADNHPKINQRLEKVIRLKELGDSSLNIVFRAWCKSDDYWDVHYDLMEQAKLRFDEEGISIPYPQMDIHVKEGLELEIKKGEPIEC